MKSIVAGQHAVTRLEFAELAFGVDLELFAGKAGETAQEWAARTDAARDIWAELAEQDPEAAAFAADLMKLAAVPLRRRRAGGRPQWSAVAA
ncbi:hypothetical protein ACFW1A_14780 [Kitasatospora sp. NPDC058965]|uniref:hypothetical protein n=1 Tax=Kitasatospora sp. NPDC058965 TaxID=3346682 RepID=UPI00369C2D63